MKNTDFLFRQFRARTHPLRPFQIGIFGVPGCGKSAYAREVVRLAARPQLLKDGSCTGTRVVVHDPVGNWEAEGIGVWSAEDRGGMMADRPRLPLMPWKTHREKWPLTTISDDDLLKFCQSEDCRDYIVVFDEGDDQAVHDAKSPLNRMLSRRRHRQLAIVWCSQRLLSMPVNTRNYAEFFTLFHLHNENDIAAVKNLPRTPKDAQTLIPSLSIENHEYIEIPVRRVC